MRVLAQTGCICPRENRRDPPIDDKTPVEVPETTYYRRRIADGSLVYAVHAAPKAPSASAATNEKKGDAKQ